MLWPTTTVLAAIAASTISLVNGQAPNAVQNWKNEFATVDFKTGPNGSFSAVWNNRPGGNFVVGRGYQPARDMLVNYSGTFSTTGWAYLALYGWTRNPLVEYYVIEYMGAHNPADNRSATQYGCLQSDGGTYEIWQKERINAPSIDGDKTNFQQFWSVRTTRHVGGTINTGNHFRAWEAAGLKLGRQQYMDIAIEGQRGAGSANITVGIAPKTPVPNFPTPTYRSEKPQGTCKFTTSSTTRRTTTTPTATTKTA
ncbi:glycoside hydrolase family 11 protein [Microdochium nivale]|nr:glycoside hydrolase family 11 protein [Microdochium nivale]